MKKITVNDLRLALMHAQGGLVNKGIVADISDEDLLKKDFNKDFHFGNIRVLNVIIELERMYGFCLPLDLFKTQADNTVGSLLDIINKHLSKIA